MLPGAESAGPVREATDSTSLTVTKTWNGTGWDIGLSWDGGTPGYTVSWSSDPTFQNGVVTLSKDTTSTGLTVGANTEKTLECFAVTDSTIVSPAVQGMGYDPEPAPVVSSIEGDGLWWGDSFTVVGNYMDKIKTGNVTGLYDRPVRASAADGTGTYATTALFDIPDDARGGPVFVQAHGRVNVPVNVPVLHLYPKGIAAYTNIHGVAWAPQTGHLWLAADGTVDEIDVFQHTPSIVRSLTGYTHPFISRVTSGGVLLVVDGVTGVTQVDQVNVTTGAVTPYAQTHAGSFTRDILPLGIAADPDGSVCYIADANLNKLVRIPYNAGSGPVITDNWGNFTWQFPVPCGMDVHVGHQVMVAYDAVNPWIGYVQNSVSTYWLTYTDTVVHSMEEDRDISSAYIVFLYDSSDPGIAEAYNGNPIGPYPAAYHGAVLFGSADGHVQVDPNRFYMAYNHYPQRVVLSNSGQAVPYPSPLQSIDRVIPVIVQGWSDVSVKLRVIDPPDLSGYAPYGGYPARHDTAAPPYEANDNFGTTDYGVATLEDGSDATVEKTVHIPASSPDGTMTVYLKVPARYSGDNFQVEITKCNAAGTPIPQKITGLSSVYTSWKRVFVERDKMFRSGGLLFEDYDPATCSPNCNQIKVYDWSILANGDQIVVFDEIMTAEGGGQIRTVVADPVPGPPNSGYSTVTLNYPLTGYFHATNNDGMSPPKPTFANGHSGGVGVIGLCDSNPNQINGSTSCFYDADMRAVETPYDDAYLEFFAQRPGAGAVPLLPPSFFGGFHFDTGGDCTNKNTAAIPGYDWGPMQRFGWLWDSHHGQANHMWLCGAGRVSQLETCTTGNCDPQAPLPQYLGLTHPDQMLSFVNVGALQDFCPSPSWLANAVEDVSNHEPGHGLHVNPNIPGGHDTRCEWPITGQLLCTDSDPSCDNHNDGCLMGGPTDIWLRHHRFCRHDLLCGDSACPNGQQGCCTQGSSGCTFPGNGAIREFIDGFQGVSP